MDSSEVDSKTVQAVSLLLINACERKEERSVLNRGRNCDGCTHQVLANPVGSFGVRRAYVILHQAEVDPEGADSWKPSANCALHLGSVTLKGDLGGAISCLSQW